MEPREDPHRFERYVAVIGAGEAGRALVVSLSSEALLLNVRDHDIEGVVLESAEEHTP